MIQQAMDFTDRQLYLDIFQQHGIKLTPAGIWTTQPCQECQGCQNQQECQTPKKTGTSTFSTHRKNHLGWLEYDEDNMAKHYIQPEQELLVVDVDGEHLEFLPDGSIDIPSLNIQLPNTLYTRTTAQNKYHFYYTLKGTDFISTDLPARVVALLDTKVDVFTYGNIFEWHSFSKHHHIHNIDKLPQVPTTLLNLLDSLELPTHRGGAVTPTTNIQRANLIKMFLNTNQITEKPINADLPHFHERKQWFAFYKSIMPLEYRPKNRRKLTIKDFPLSYDLFNKLATKLTATAELDHYKHTVPTLQKLLTMWGIDPLSKKSQQLLFKNILPSLPEHEAIESYKMDDDVLTLQEHLDAQEGTHTPVFRVIWKNLRYLEINKHTQEPVAHNGEFLLEEKTAISLHDERNIMNEDGRMVGWDNNVPIVYFTNNPYKPAYEFDEDQWRHIVNLYTESEYLKQKSQLQHLPQDNIISKLLDSTVGPHYKELVLAYYAQIIFGRESPTMVMWMAALETEKGGSGKSAVTLEIPSLILQGAASAIDVKTITSGWGDIVSQSRMLSLEDMPKVSKKEWDMVYAMIKQQNTNSFRKLNMKGTAIKTERVAITLTGSTNYRPELSPSDRRFLCLEPAHFHGITQPLSDEDAQHLSNILSTHDYDVEIQEFTDHLYYLFTEGFSKTIKRQMFIEAPHTPYRSKWIQAGATNSKNIIHLLTEPKELNSFMKMDSSLEIEHLANLYRFVLHTYNPDTGRVGIPYKWFEEILPFAQSDAHRDAKYSQAIISKMLGVDFTNVGIKYSSKWRDDLPDYFPQHWREWPHAGYTFLVTDQMIQEYRELASELLMVSNNPGNGPDLES